MEITSALPVIFVLLVLITQENEILCRQIRVTRDATHTNPNVCLKTHENDTACLITSRCKDTDISCPLIQSQSGVIMCDLDNSQNDLSDTACFRACHTDGFKVDDPKCLGPREDETILRSNNNLYLFDFTEIDNYQEFVGPSNLPLSPGCNALNVSASICDVFTKYRVLLCGGSVWKQVQCYLGNCNTKTWPTETTLECQYAVVDDGVALCPLPKYSKFSCRFICLQKNETDTCFGEPRRYDNTKVGRREMRKDHNIKKTTGKASKNCKVR